MVYTPGRDGRFHYIWDLMEFIEEGQCRSCAFSKLNDPTNDPSHAEEYPMCWEVESRVMLEEPVEALDKQPNGDVLCSRYRNVVLAEEEHPDQSRLPLDTDS